MSISQTTFRHCCVCFYAFYGQPLSKQLYEGLYIDLVGEIFELKAELNSDKKDRKKEAVKKVIASMTVGKDVRCGDYLHFPVNILSWFAYLVIL